MVLQFLWESRLPPSSRADSYESALFLLYSVVMPDCFYACSSILTDRTKCNDLIVIQWNMCRFFIPRCEGAFVERGKEEYISDAGHTKL